MEITFGQLSSEALAVKAGKALLLAKASLARGQVEELRCASRIYLCKRPVNGGLTSTRLSGHWANPSLPTSSCRTAATTMRVTTTTDALPAVPQPYVNIYTLPFNWVLSKFTR